MPADLDYIRALLIAQTAKPDPAPRGLLGRLTIGKRRPPPPSLDMGPAVTRFDPALFEDTDQVLLIQQICWPSDADAPLEIEAASPLPLPSGRGEFGRRLDLQPEAELILDQPVADAQAVPYFPEDLMEPVSPWAPAPPSEPMRPWIKALRSSGLHAPPIPASPTTPKRKSRPKKLKAAKATPVAPPSVGHDLLSALALTLAYEHDSLSDRLAALDLFVASSATLPAPPPSRRPRPTGNCSRRASR